MNLNGTTRMALIGCGFVAEFYAGAMRAHPELEIAGVMDIDARRSAKFAKHYRLPLYSSLEELLKDPSIGIVLNLTNPRSHYEVSRKSLEAGKHVYSEKPLALRLSEAEELVDLASRKGLQIVSAPCSALGETAQTIWKALRRNEIGKVLLVEAELDEGFLARSSTRFRHSKSKTGTPWPWEDELTVGCTMEHAGYYLAWLAMFFGRTESVTALSGCCMHEKWTAEGVAHPAPDYSLACLRYESGVVARLTCSIIAPHNHRLVIVGEEGVLRTHECWDYLAGISIQKHDLFGRIANRYPIASKLPFLGECRYPLLKSDCPDSYRKTNKMDFCRGPSELARAVSEGRQCRLSGPFSLHVNEVALAIHNAPSEGATYRVKSTFEPMRPMEWAL